MNHKRKRSKSRRAGCLLCKPWKANGAKGGLKNQTMQERKAVEDERQQIGFEVGVQIPESFQVVHDPEMLTGKWDSLGRMAYRMQVTKEGEVKFEAHGRVTTVLDNLPPNQAGLIRVKCDGTGEPSATWTPTG